MTRHGLRAVACSILGLAAGWAWSPTPVSGQAAPERVLWESFSDGLGAWHEQPLDRRSTDYRVLDLHGDAVLESASAGGATALVRPLRPGPVAGGRIRWRWRVVSSLTENLHETERRGDDYAARVFVLFGDPDFGQDTRALAYAWAGRQPAGRIYPNPYLPNVMTVVLRSGDERAGEWHAEDRDLLSDYMRAFGEPAPDVAAIAVLVDTDDTGGAARAWFDDFELFTRVLEGPRGTRGLRRRADDDTVRRTGDRSTLHDSRRDDCDG